MTFIPQALADPRSRSVLFVWRNEENFKTFWADKVKTVDAKGIEIHPFFIKVGDVIDSYVTGWSKDVVEYIKFKPDSFDIPEIQRSGTIIIKTKSGTLSSRIDGRKVIDRPLYVFLNDDEEVKI